MAWGQDHCSESIVGVCSRGFVTVSLAGWVQYTVTPEGPCCQFFGFLCVHVYIVVCGMNSKESLHNGPIPLV